MKYVDMQEVVFDGCDVTSSQSRGITIEGVGGAGTRDNGGVAILDHVLAFVSGDGAFRISGRSSRRTRCG